MPRTGSLHTHEFAQTNTTVLEHNHRVKSILGPAIVLCDGSHVHRLRSFTTFDREHNHRVNTPSSRQINVGRGFHTHVVRTVTSFDREHRHRLAGLTQVAPNIPRRIIRMILRRRKKR